MIVLNKDLLELKIFQSEIGTRLIDDCNDLMEHGDLEGEKIRIMPDGHPGLYVPIGFTSTTEGGRLDPRSIGVDIGCGVSTYKLGKFNPDVVELDTFIENEIPHGRQVHEEQKVSKDIYRLIAFIANSSGMDNVTRAVNSLGTLGGGNHFISLSKDEDEVVYLTIHSGSRSFGYNVAKLWEKKAKNSNNRKARNKIIEEYKAANRHTEIEEALSHVEEVPDYLTGLDSTAYFRVVGGLVQYASINRNMMADKIMNFLGVDQSTVEIVESVHNYIGDDGIIRKGAISAYEGQKVVIPVNVLDGIIIAEGKSNEDWNYSAPHGAGRNFSRTDAKELLSAKEQQKMLDDAGIYAAHQPLDEMADAYRRLEYLLPLLEPTVEVKKVLKTFYNFQT
jgi:tRNA-splicing ligase RtcB